MATHSSVLAWRIPGTGEPGGLLSMGSHRVRHDWSDLAAVAAAITAGRCQDWRDRRLIIQGDVGREFREKGIQIIGETKILFPVKDFKTLPTVFIAAIMLLIKDMIIEKKVDSYISVLCCGLRYWARLLVLEIAQNALFRQSNWKRQILKKSRNMGKVKKAVIVITA